ncbi:MAG TPA: hypothetical protein VFT79_13560 [Solirubrobacterales bacterium]|nr:hypothetical protein [Solirubrobacterales bacterium]
MSPIDRFILLIRDLRRNERGMALPTAIFAMVASMGFAGAAVISSVNVQQGSHRDGDSKSAIAAADAGASVALLRLNRYASAFSASAPCLGVSGSTLVLSAAAADGWCPPISGQVGSSTYVYRSTPAVGSTTMSVVATGTSGPVSRRIAITYKTTTVGSALGKEGVIGVDKVEIDNNADARVGVGTNGDVYVHNNGNVCGNVRHGVGKKATFENNGTQCSGYGINEGNVTLPPVSSFMPTDIATNNNNFRLVTCAKITSTEREPEGCQSDTYTGKWKSTEPWDPSTRTIYASNNTTLTLGGGDYWVCRLYIRNNSHLVMAGDAQVRLFFDTPENCGLKSGEKQIDINNNADVTATGYQPEIGKFDMPGFYVMGSPSFPTTIEFSNNSGNNEFILYAPNSNIVVKNNATYTGVIAGKTVHLDNNAIVRQDAGFEPPKIGGATIYERQSYVECTGATAPAGQAPNANC